MVFRSYLNNSFILNQYEYYMEELENCSREREEIMEDIKSLIHNIYMMMPPSLINQNTKLKDEEFIEIVQKVKTESIINIAERRRN